MEKLIPYIAKINSAWSLCALIVVVIYYIIAKSKPKGWLIAFALFIILLLFLLPILADTYLKTRGLYRVRINVIGPERLPIENTKIWSTAGGEPKAVSGGWEIDIPPQSLSVNKNIIFYASLENAFLKGQKDTVLGDDYNPQVTLKLIKDTTALIGGTVVDDSGHPIEGVGVFVFGYSKEGVTTDKGGSFTLFSHAAINEQIRLHAEKPNSQFLSVENYFSAGDKKTAIVLKHK